MNSTTIANPPTITLDGKEYVVMPADEFDRLFERIAETHPELPAKDGGGHRPAIETGRAILARKLIRKRQAAGWTQEDLARRAKVRIETVGRLEAGKHRPQTATLARIEAAFAEAGV